MTYLQAVLFIALAGGFMAAVHHGAVAIRRSAALEQGLPELVPTTQHDLMRLDAICAVVVLVALAIRALQGVPAGISALYAPAFYGLLYTTLVWWRYPDAHPGGVFYPDWRGRPAWVGSTFRWLIALSAGGMAALALYAVVFVRQ